MLNTIKEMFPDREMTRTLVSRETCCILLVKAEASVVSTFPFILETYEQNFNL